MKLVPKWTRISLIRKLDYTPYCTDNGGHNILHNVLKSLKTVRPIYDSIVYYRLPDVVGFYTCYHRIVISVLSDDRIDLRGYFFSRKKRLGIIVCRVQPKHRRNRVYRYTPNARAICGIFFRNCFYIAQ